MAVNNSETADRLVRRRAQMLPMMAMIFIAQQASYFSGTRMDEGNRLVNYIAIGGWIAMSTVLLFALATGGGWFRSAHVRALTNDESTRANRAEAFRIGFLVTMIAALALYVVSLFEPIGAREAIHILMTAGIATALLRFGMLERRALRDA
jgi:predicted permease